MLFSASAFSLFCYAITVTVSILVAIILKWKRKLVALLLLSYRCIVATNDLMLFLTVQLVGLQCVIVVFPYHTCLLFKLEFHQYFTFSIIS